jgi:hypothetical protein
MAFQSTIDERFIDPVICCYLFRLSRVHSSFLARFIHLIAHCPTRVDIPIRTQVPAPEVVDLLRSISSICRLLERHLEDDEATGNDARQLSAALARFVRIRYLLRPAFYNENLTLLEELVEIARRPPPEEKVQVLPPPVYRTGGRGRPSYIVSADRLRLLAQVHMQLPQ